MSGTLRLVWRRNRVFYLVWLYLLVLTLPATAKKYHDLVPAGSDPASLMAGLGGNPTMRALLGPPFDLSSPGGFTFWRVGTFAAAAAAMMAALGVIRSTRAEEEQGRTELLRAGAVAPRTPFAAGVLMAWLVCLATGVLTAVAMVVVRTPVAGSCATGAAVTLTGCMGAGLGALAAQVFESARAARGWGVGAGVGALYLLRAAVDASGDGSTVNRLRWAMPYEWGALARPYAHERWWVLLLPLALAVLTSALALHVDAGRDLGAGLRPASLGPSGAPGWLRGGASLAWRLQRGQMLGWGLGVLASALGMGAMSIQLGATLRDNPQVADMMRRLGATASDPGVGFHQAMLSILVTVISLGMVALLGHVRQEEASGRAELLLGTPVSRARFALPHIGVALGLGVAATVLTGVLLPLAQGVHDHSAQRALEFVPASLALLPGVLLVAGIAVLLLGWAPRAFGLAWAAVGWSMLAAWVLPLFDPPSWLVRLQPWGHLARLPSDHLAWTPVLAETLVGAALLVAGVAGYRRRDLPAH